MREILQWAFMVLILTSCLGVLFNLGLNVSDRIHRAECIEWRNQASEVSNYYITQWQSDQCNYQGVYVGAPVK